jgi:hypothetical protein
MLSTKCAHQSLLDRDKFRNIVKFNSHIAISLFGVQQFRAAVDQPALC